MTPVGIGGKVLDASAVAAFLRGRLSALTWFDVAATSGIVLYLPTLALDEVQAIRPWASVALADLATDVSVLVKELDESAAASVDRLLDTVGMFDALAGQVVHVARERGWPVMTDDPGRIHRIDPALDVDRL